MKFTIRQFNDRFPTSDACLEELKQLRFSNWTCPKCSRLDMLSKITGRPQYACVCGYQVAPLAGTIFHKSSSDLRDWFYAMYLMTQTRAGISAKQLERELGCTYKTAWRMFKQIRSLMAENDGNLLTGIVEVDETYVGGRKKGMQGGASNHKGVVMGMVERGTGRVRTEVIAKASTPELARGIRKHVSKEATLMTDEHRGYQPMLRVGYQHWSVNHQESWTIGSIHTNTIEGFWSQLKLGITGVYRHVDLKYLNSYANEYAWRYSNRRSPVPMFDLLLKRLYY